MLTCWYAYYSHQPITVKVVVVVVMAVAALMVIITTTILPNILSTISQVSTLSLGSSRNSTIQNARDVR